LDSWRDVGLKTLLLPSGVVVLTAVFLFGVGLLPLPTPALTFYYYSVFAMGILLAWRFHSSRVLFALLIILLSQRALEFFAGAKPAHSGPGRIAFEVLAFLLPLNLLWLGWLRERGLVLSVSASRLALIFVQAVYVAVQCRPQPPSSHSLLSHPWLNPHWFSWAKIPQTGLLAFALAGAVLLLRALHSRRPVDSGFFWGLISIFLAFEAGGVGRLPTAYMGTAGLCLVLATIESSYFMAYHDELTGLPSRRAFNESLLGLQDGYTIAIVDIDHFKQFNDTYGHEIGDEVLRMVAGRLARVRGGGRSYRCGGEEFAILFPRASVKEALPELESLRTEIERSRFRFRGQERRVAPRGPDRRKLSAKLSPGTRSLPPAPEGLSVTVSIGVAEPGVRYRDVESVIAAADKALYRAKAAGRNRVEIAGTRRARSLRLERQGIA
jgi:diguanylate cyclase (GGDEF)-like protein